MGDGADDLVDFIWREQLRARARAIHRQRKRPSAVFANLENSMSQEERTRDEVLNALVAQTKALAIAVDALAIIVSRARVEGAPPAAVPVNGTRGEPLGPPLSNPAEMNPTPPSESKSRVKRREIQQAAPAPAPAPAPEKQMADIKPVVPTPGLGELRAALQECITAHGMTVAKQRLAPYGKISDVPADRIGATIDALKAK